MTTGSGTFRRSSRVVAAVAVVVLVAAACGSSKSSSSGGSSSSSGGSNTASAPGITATAVTIGSHQPLTGPAAPGYSEIAPAAKAFFQYVNSKGGVNGRTINYIYEDDAYNPANTATVVRKLVLQDNVFAITNGLGTPTHEAVVQYLNSSKIPDLFVASGCDCWSDASAHPYTFGYQTDYTIEGKVQGTYINSKYQGQKVAYIYQNDDFGQGGTKGLNDIIPKSNVVSQQPYDVASLTGGLGNQVSAAKSAGAQVLVLYTIPAATALSLLAAAELNYHPVIIVSSVGADPPTLNGLLSNYSKGKANGSLENGVITSSYLPSEFDTSNPWITLFHQIHDQYDASQPWDGNTVYGMAWAYTFTQALKAAGKNPTRQSIVNAVNSQGSSWKGPGLVPFGYSSSDHGGYIGEQMGTVNNGSLTLSGPVYTTRDTGAVTTVTATVTTPPSTF